MDRGPAPAAGHQPHPGGSSSTLGSWVEKLQSNSTNGILVPSMTLVVDRRDLTRAAETLWAALQRRRNQYGVFIFDFVIIKNQYFILDDPVFLYGFMESILDTEA